MVCVLSTAYGSIAIRCIAKKKTGKLSLAPFASAKFPPFLAIIVDSFGVSYFKGGSLGCVKMPLSLAQLCVQTDLYQIGLFSL